MRYKELTVKLGVITDGISRDFEHALNVMAEYGLRYPELQFVWDREVGDHERRASGAHKGTTGSARHGSLVHLAAQLWRLARIADRDRRYHI